MGDNRSDGITRSPPPTYSSISPNNAQPAPGKKNGHMPTAPGLESLAHSPTQRGQTSRQNISTLFRLANSEKLKAFSGDKQKQILEDLQKYDCKQKYLDALQAANDEALHQGIVASLRFVPDSQIKLQESAFAKIVPALSIAQTEHGNTVIKGFMEASALEIPRAELTSDAIRKINNDLTALLHKQGFRIIDSATHTEAGDIKHVRGNNCLIYSVVQQILHDKNQAGHTPQQGVSKEIQAFVEDVRTHFDKRHPEHEDKMLYADHVEQMLPILAERYKAVFKKDLPTLNVKCINAFNTCDVFSLKNSDVGAMDGNTKDQSIVIWHRNEHFVGITATEDAKSTDHPLFQAPTPESLPGIVYGGTDKPPPISQVAKNFDDLLVSVLVETIPTIQAHTKAAEAAVAPAA